MGDFYVRTFTIAGTIVLMDFSTSPTFLVGPDTTTVSVALTLDAANFTITANTDGSFDISIQSGLQVQVITTDTFEFGCYAIHYTSGASLLSGIPDILLQPGGINMAVGETYYIELSPSLIGWSAEACCVRRGMKVHTTEGLIPIEKVKTGDFVLNFKGKKVEVLYNAKYPTRSSKFCKIDKGALGPNSPTSDLFLTNDHPILKNGMILKISDFENSTPSSETDEVFSLVTEKEDWLMIENVPVKSFEKTYFENYTSDNHILWVKN